MAPTAIVEAASEFQPSPSDRLSMTDDLPPGPNHSAPGPNHSVDRLQLDDYDSPDLRDWAGNPSVTTILIVAVGKTQLEVPSQPIK
ncbi:MAG: hypothetical protein AABP62_30000 [Planctomycetota bacterium]